MRTNEEWAALCAASESDKPHEWPYILAVIRNRVEAKGRFRDTYEEVVRQPWQFSYFNKSMGTEDSEAAFQDALLGYPGSRFEEALQAATFTLMAPRWAMPLGPKAYYFWSPISMKPEGSWPDWDFDKLRVFTVAHIDPWRFHFAEEVQKSNPYAGRQV